MATIESQLTPREREVLGLMSVRRGFVEQLKIQVAAGGDTALKRSPNAPGVMDAAARAKVAEAETRRISTLISASPMVRARDYIIIVPELQGAGFRLVEGTSRGSSTPGLTVRHQEQKAYLGGRVADDDAVVFTESIFACLAGSSVWTDDRPGAKYVAEPRTFMQGWITAAAAQRFDIYGADRTRCNIRLHHEVFQVNDDPSVGPPIQVIGTNAEEWRVFNTKDRVISFLDYGYGYLSQVYFRPAWPGRTVFCRTHVQFTVSIDLEGHVQFGAMDDQGGEYLEVEVAPAEFGTWPTGF